MIKGAKLAEQTALEKVPRDSESMSMPPEALELLNKCCSSSEAAFDRLMGRHCASLEQAASWGGWGGGGAGA